MRKTRVAVSLMALMLIFACASMQDQWNKLTPNEQARVVVNGFQKTIESLFDTGKTYVTANPDKQTVWKQKAIPAFDAANQAIISSINVIAAGGATPDAMYKSIGPLMQAVQDVLILIGVPKDKVLAKGGTS